MPQLGQRAGAVTVKAAKDAGAHDSVVSERLFQPLYEGDRESGITPHDSISQVVAGAGDAGSAKEDDEEGFAEEEVDPTSPEALMEKAPVKKDFIKMLLGLVPQAAAEETPKEASDAMEAFFGESKAYCKDPADRGGLTLTSHQSKLLGRFLASDDKPADVRGSVSKAKCGGIPIKEEDYKKFFRPAAINPSVVSYNKLLKRGKEATNFKSKKQVVFRWGSPVAKEMDGDLKQLDHLSRLGLRHTTYEQWLMTSLKMRLVADLGRDHPAVQTDGPVWRICDELFAASTAQMEIFARSALVENLARRKLILSEIPLQPEPHQEALNLPMDKTGQYLFGEKVDGEGKVIASFELIAPNYADKIVAIRDAKAALKNPFGLSLPAGLPKESPEKGNWADKSKKQASTNKARKRPSNNQSQGFGGRSNNPTPPKRQRFDSFDGNAATDHSRDRWQDRGRGNQYHGRRGGRPPFRTGRGGG